MKKKLRVKSRMIGDKPNKVVVAIHGWSGNCSNMELLLPSFNLKETAFFFPEAPYLVNGIKGKYSWSYQTPEGSWEVEEPTQLLRDFFTGLFKQFDSQKVYVMGFSQGGMVCLDMVLHLEHRLGGVFPIAGFLRDPESDKKRCHINQLSTPVVICHGKADDRVPADYSRKAFELLKGQGANVELLLYNGKHKIGIECIRRMKEIIDIN